MLRSGIRRRSGGLTVVVAPGPGPVPRIGVVAGKRVGAAVARNRAKRRIREALTRVPLQGEADYVVIASPEVNEVEFDRLVAWLERATVAEGDM